MPEYYHLFIMLWAMCVKMLLVFTSSNF